MPTPVTNSNDRQAIRQKIRTVENRLREMERAMDAKKIFTLTPVEEALDDLKLAIAHAR